MAETQAKRSKRSNSTWIKKKPGFLTINMINNTAKSRLVIDRIRVPLSSDQQSAPSAPAPTPLVNDYDIDDDCIHDIADGPTSCTSHETRKQRLAAEWQRIQSIIINATVKSMPLQKDEDCIFCLSTKAEIRCLSCVGRSIFCKECAILLHSKVNITHPLLLWNVSV